MKSKIEMATDVKSEIKKVSKTPQLLARDVKGVADLVKHFNHLLVRVEKIEKAVAARKTNEGR